MALTQISTDGVKNDAISAGKIPANAVGSSEIADDAVGAAQIADDGVAQAAVADEAIDEARLQISNAGSNGQFLQKQSGNTGGLTWATVTVPDADKVIEGNTSVEAVDTGSDGHVKITTEGVERLKVQADGDVCIGNNATSMNNAADNLIVGSGSGHNGITIYSGADSDGWTIFNDGDNSNLTGALKYNHVDNYLAFYANAGEKYRIGSSGQLGIGGATYGTSGQVLTSGGASAAPSWAAVPPGGNSIDLVADGAIAAGKPVIIKSNGKAEVIAEVLTTRALSSGPATHNSNALNHNHGSLTGCYSSGQNKWVTWHVNNDDSAKPWVTCWRHAGTNDISKDEASAFSHIGDSSILNDNDYRPRMAYDVNADKVVGIWRKSHPNNRLGAWCGTVPPPGTNSSVTFGSGPIEAHADDVKMMDLIYDPDAQKCIAVFMDEGDSDKGKSVVLTTTGSGASASVSASSAVTFYDSYCGYKALAYDTVNDKTVVFYTGASNYIYAKPSSISGTTLTWGTQEGIVNAGVSNQIDVAYGNGIFFLVYSRSSDIKGKAVSYDGSSWSHGSEFDIVTSCNDEWPEITYDPETNLFLIAIRVDSNGVRTYMASNSGTTVTMGAGIYHSGSNMNRRIYIPDKTGTTLLVHSSQSGSTRLKAVVTRHADLISNLNTGGANFLGVAEDAISDGATGTIKLEGNVVGNQSGLTPGNLYYWTVSGAITSGGGLAYPGGLAVAADKILIRRKTT